MRTGTTPGGNSRYVRITADGRRFQEEARRKRGDVTLAPVRPNAGLRVAYQRKLEALIDEMHASVAYWIKVRYRANASRVAQDASPAVVLSDEMRRLVRQWQGRFDEAAPELAAYFATRAEDRSSKALASILRRAGISVAFKMTAAANDVLQATIAEQVALIKSIPAEHLADVEGIVMRGVQNGRDLRYVSRALQERYGVTKHRAALISRDQNNKATASMTRARQKELGITKAIWLHSAGGKKPRPAHVAYSGKRYNVETGAYIDGEWIFPGELINCRCVSRSVLPEMQNGR